MSRADISAPAIAAGLLAAFVGWASTFAVILRGLTAVGATPEQAASGLLAVSVAMGIGGIVLSLWTRMPVSIAWSTPGAALLASSSQLPGGFPVAVGGFLVSGALIVIAGQVKPLARAVAAIPAPIANAMLAGVLLPLCLAPARAVAAKPVAGLAIVVTWALVARFRRLWAMPAAVAVAALVIVLTTPLDTISAGSLLPVVRFVAPEFSLGGLAGIALPLFIVTMASQNIPGMAILNVNGFRPDTGRIFSATGILSLLAAPIGGLSVNLAAITAAICAGPEAGPEPARRFWAATTAGIAYCFYGLLAAAATAFIAAAPPLLIEAVAGLALLGSFGNALLGALAEPGEREAAVITFAVAASGMSFWGIGAAFWGLIAGAGIHALTRWNRG